MSGQFGLWSGLRLGGVAAVLCAGLAACGQEQTVARVATATITATDIRSFVSQLADGLRPEGAGLQARREYLQSLIDRQLLLAEARARGLDTTLAIRRQVQDAVDGRARQLYQARDIAARVEVSPEEVRSYFEDSGFDRERELWAIRTRTRQEILDVVKRLKGGERFEDLARSYSQDARSAERGGLLGFVSLNIAEQLGIPADVFLSLPVGELSPPLPVASDWHVFRFAEDQPAEFAKYHDLIDTRLRKMRAQALLDEQLEGLRVDLAVQLGRDGLGRVVAAIRRRDLDDLEGAQEPVYTYDGGSITLDDVHYRLLGRRNLAALADPDRAAEILSSAVLRPQLLAIAAQRAGIYEEEGMQVYRRREEEDVLLQRVRRELVGPQPAVTEEDARQYYDANEAVFIHEDAVWIDELLLGSREEAERLLAAIRDGASFAEYAERSLRAGAADSKARHHLHPREGGLYPVLVPAAMGAPVGELVGPLEVRGGWSVFRVVGREKGQMEPWDSARPRARTLVARQREERRFQEAVQQLRAQYSDRVEIFDDRLTEALPDSLLTGVRPLPTEIGASP